MSLEWTLDGQTWSAEALDPYEYPDGDNGDVFCVSIEPTKDGGLHIEIEHNTRGTMGWGNWFDGSVEDAKLEAETALKDFMDRWGDQLDEDISMGRWEY